ncbi:MAG: 30S ribosome-binding factor RbfA [Waddliaceae bacterium]|nr:30S ribosome-binding factor RbfA [Waddliaceae bacterium]
MTIRRINKINSLLKEVISDVITKNVKHPLLSDKLLTITHVDVSKDLHHAKVYVSIIGDAEEKSMALEALTSAAGFIAVNSSKKVSLHFFPELAFKIDDASEKHMHIDDIISKITAEREHRSE